MSTSGLTSWPPMAIGVLVIGGVASLISGWAALQARRRLDTAEAESTRGLIRPFVWIASVIGLSGLAYGIGLQYLETRFIGIGLLIALVLLFGPWTVFALRYTGRGGLLSRRRIAGLGALQLSTLVTLAAQMATVPVAESSVQAVTGFLISSLLLTIIGGVFLACGLVLLATYRYESQSVATGVMLVLPVSEPTFAVTVLGRFGPTVERSVAGLALVVAAAGLLLSVTRYDVFDSPPSTAAIGERTAIDDLPEAVLIVDRQGTIVRVNAAADALLETATEGSRLDTVLDYELPELDAADTIELWTAEGRRRFDPRVSPLRGEHGDPAGHTVVLVDVTDRETRRQRIQVLNRILQHNIRNELSVITGRAELAVDDDRSVETQIGKILGAAENLERLSVDARRIERLIDGTEPNCEPERCRLRDLVEVVIEEAVDEPTDVTVRTDVPPVTVRIDRAQLKHALRNVIENAIEHNDSAEPVVEIRAERTGPGLRMTVDDNGPGIPPAEREVLAAGGEDPLSHTTSLGLWGTNWAVRRLGGELTLGESDLGGASVRIDLPVDVGAAPGDHPVERPDQRTSRT